MNILFTIDHNYLSVLKVCVKSIIRFSNHEGYQIYIIHSDIKTHDQREFAKTFENDDVAFHFLNIPIKRFENFPENQRYPKSMYYRILAAQLLPKHLDKILYLDPDIIVINELNELYNISFDNHYFIACTHVRKLLGKINQLRLGIDLKEDYPYINTGVMMMNLKDLRLYQQEEEIIQYVNQYRDKLVLPDQDILTALYGQKIKIIEYHKYNLSDRMLMFYNVSLKRKINMEWIKKNTVIIHYCGKNKPWNDHYIGVLKVFYDEVVDML